jgi:hypothetical protein
MQIVLTTSDSILIVLGLAAGQFLVGAWIKSRLESSIKSEYDKVLEDYRFDLKAREQASKVAEYIAIARGLRTDSSELDYRRANQLAWELSLWLPDELYRRLGRALSASTPEDNILSVLVDVRRLLLKLPGTLTDADIIHHSPGIGATHKT